MRISDWSSDVCSSDLRQISAFRQALAESWAWLAENSLDILSGLFAAALLVFLLLAIRSFGAWLGREQGISTLRLVVRRVIRQTHPIGRAPCRERECQYRSILVGAGTLKKTKKQ